MSIEAILANPSEISLSRQASLRASLKLTKNHLKQVIGLRKTQRLNLSRKTMIKNGSSQTFETEQPLKSFEKVFDESQIYSFQTGLCLTKHSNQRWSTNKHAKSRNFQEIQAQTIKRHRKTYSVNHQTLMKQKAIKTEPSLEQQTIPINIERFIKQVKLNKISLANAIQVPQSSLTINQIMINKFSSRRRYENSKIVRRDMLPNFLNFSISKCQVHEKMMTNTISSNLFQKHEVFFDTKSFKN